MPSTYGLSNNDGSSDVRRAIGRDTMAAIIMIAPKIICAFKMPNELIFFTKMLIETPYFTTFYFILKYLLNEYQSAALLSSALTRLHR